MARLIEDGTQWPLYQYIIKELAQNGAIDLKDHPQFIDQTNPKFRKNKLSDPISNLALPASHRARVRNGLTVEESDTRCRGAVIRVGMGQYIWDKDMVITGRRFDTLVTDDPEVAERNPMWNIRKPRHTKPDSDPTKSILDDIKEEKGITVPAPTPFEQAVAEDLIAMQNKVIEKAAELAMPTAPKTLEVIAQDGTKMILRNGDKVYIVDIREELPSGGGA